MRIVSIVISLAVAQSATIMPARADGCTVAVLDYNYILPRLNDAMDKFSTCIADSKGTDKCLKEFSQLRIEHEQFAAAVATYMKECR
jgi:hypothetical protein